MSAEFHLSLPPKTVENAEQKAKPALQETLSHLGFVPNMYALMANSRGSGLPHHQSGTPLRTACWQLRRSSARHPSGFRVRRAGMEKELADRTP